MAGLFGGCELEGGELNFEYRSRKNLQHRHEVICKEF